MVGMLRVLRLLLALALASWCTRPSILPAPSSDLERDLATALGGDCADAFAALTRIEAIGPAALPAAPRLIVLLDDEDVPQLLMSHRTRNTHGIRAARSLARIGHPVVPALTEALKSENETRRGNLVWVLAQLDHADAIAVLTRLAATDPVPGVRT